MVVSIQEILRQFMTLPWQNLAWSIVSFHETLPLPGSIFRAVERKQTELWTFPQVPLNRHHYDMCRFISDDDPSSIKILESMRNIILDSNSKDQAAAHSTLTSTEQEILQSLPFEDASIRVPDAYRDTCSWFLEHVTYNSWLQKPRQTLWLEGKPGSGKSVLSKYFINHLSETTADSAQVIRFFFSQHAMAQSMTRFLSSVLHQQLVRSAPSFTASEIFTNLTENREVRGADTPWDDDLLMEYVLRLVDQSTALGQSLYIIIDALDECTDPDKVIALLDLLNTRFDPPRRIWTYISSRQSASFSPVWKICLEDNNFLDIQNYLNDKIKKTLQDFNSCLVVQAHVQTIAEKSQGVFPWASLVVSDMLLNLDRMPVKTALALALSLPTDLMAAYRTTLERLWDSSYSKQSRRLAQDALILVICAQRPLSILELRSALAVTESGVCHRLTMRTQDSIDIELRLNVLALCGGLLETSPQKSRSANGTITVLGTKVLLIHETVREFLMGKGSHVLETPRGKGCEADFQLRAAEICLKSINEINQTAAFPQIAAVDGGSSHFLRYAVSYGMQHLNKACQMGVRPKYEDTWRSPIFQQGFIERWAYVHKRFFGSRDHFKPVKTKAAHLMSYFGLSWLDTCVWGGNLEDINEKDHHGHTPLALAAAKGHLDICQSLLGLGANVDSRDYVYGQTPLSLAVAHGHVDIVELLINAGSGHSNYTDGTPALLLAVRTANLSIVQLLLESGASAKIPDVQTGETALSRAAALGHVPIVSLLLKSGAEVESWDKRGWTPLHYAISRGRKKTVEVLLDALKPAQLYRLKTGFVNTVHSWVDTVLRAIIFSLYLHQCGNSSTSYSQSSPSVSRQESITQGSSGHNRHSRTSDRKRGRQKQDSDSEDDCEEEDHGPNEKRPRNHHEGGKRIACPYHKKNAEKYANGSCNGKGFDTIHRLKQHLKKIHCRALVWQRCHICKARFPHDEIAGHSPCVPQKEPSDYEEGYDAAQREKLESKDLSPRKSSTVKCWNRIFKVLFPDWSEIKEIPSPYQEIQSQTMASPHQQALREYCEMITSPDTINEISSNQDQQYIRQFLERQIETLTSRLGLPSMIRRRGLSSAKESEGSYHSYAVNSRVLAEQMATTQPSPSNMTTTPSMDPFQSKPTAPSHEELHLMHNYAGNADYLPLPEQLPFQDDYSHSYIGSFDRHGSAVSSSDFNPGLCLPHNGSYMPTETTAFSDYSSRPDMIVDNSINLMPYLQQSIGSESQLQNYSCPILNVGYASGMNPPINNQETTLNYIESRAPSKAYEQLATAQNTPGRLDCTQSPEPSPGRDNSTQQNLASTLSGNTEGNNGLV
ncbi:hypothetical protein F4678DRAFT_442982 [Xylaria arbuscula]|nr:hypothetical protein F4678DRAFT_442982 [Xylaria arbuscula]